MTRDDWVRRLALGGVIIATTVLSYSILKVRAEHIGFPEWSSWLYPVGLDAMILGASRAWQDPENSTGTQRLAMWMTLCAITAGVGAFVVEFLVNGWTAVAFACLIPAALAASLVLTSRAAHDRRVAAENDAQKTQEDVVTNKATPEPVASIDPEPIAPDVTPEIQTSMDWMHAQHDKPYPPLIPEMSPGPHVTVAKAYDGSEPDTEVIEVEVNTNGRVTLGSTIEERRRWIHEQLDAGKKINGADVDREFPDVARNGARLLRSVKEERAKRPQKDKE